jgi:ROS/MUCR transcriptional regulator protein
MADHEQLLTLASNIVSAHVSNNAVPPDQLPALIQQMFNTLATVGQRTAEPPRPDPAVPVKQSVKPAHIVCQECGKQFSMIGRATTIHLRFHRFASRTGIPYQARLCRVSGTSRSFSPAPTKSGTVNSIVGYSIPGKIFAYAHVVPLTPVGPGGEATRNRQASRQ